MSDLNDDIVQVVTDRRDVTLRTILIKNSCIKRNNVDTRKIGNFEITKVDNPNGTGHSYFAKAEPEGFVLVANMGDIPVDVHAAIVAWELEKNGAKVQTPKDPQPIFNRQGWTY